jgi:hypothetical protein
MSIKPSMQYCQKSDSLKGYENTGDGCVSSDVADQTLVISIRGLYNHWKQVGRGLVLFLHRTTLAG